MEQQQYEEEMEELKEEILDSFHSFKERHFNKLNENEWDELEEYIEDYIVDEDTTFDSILEQYYDYITDKFSFNMEEKEATLEPINSFDTGEWDFDLPKKYIDIVETAKNKATSYHCRSPYFIKEEK